MLDAIIFDMDGLLVDSEPCWEEARRQLAREVGQTWRAEDTRACMGVSTLTWAKYMIQCLELDLTPDEVQARIVGNMLAIYAERIPYLPGAVEAVALAGRHYPIGLASGSHHSLIEAVVNDTLMRDKFRAVVCADNVPAGKPAPDVYLEAARQLNVDPRRCMCLEDSANGILAGKAAGMKVIAVPDPRFAPRAEVVQQADIVLASLRDFNLNIIHSLENTDAAL